MISWTVKTKKSYPVTLSETWDFSCIDNPKVCVVSDDVVAPLYLPIVAKNIRSQVFSFVVPHGEQSKSLERYQAIVKFLFDNEFTRNDALVALGGGVIGDLVGFVASTYQRGIDFYQLPTTLLAMVDASVGGKTALNSTSCKNVLGTFYQPKAVLVNTKTLDTLPQKEFLNGYGEVVKCAFLSQKVANVMQKGCTADVIEACLKLKTDVVERDECENGQRALLNLGHTVGHAVEALSGYSLSHGECVVKGLAQALKISQKFYSLSDEVLQRCNALLDNRFDYLLPFSSKEILSQIMHDKKSFGDGINLVMIHDVGDCRIEKITYAELEKLL